MANAAQAQSPIHTECSTQVGPNQRNKNTRYLADGVQLIQLELVHIYRKPTAVLVPDKALRPRPTDEPSECRKRDTRHEAKQRFRPCARPATAGQSITYRADSFFLLGNRLEEKTPGW